MNDGLGGESGKQLNDPSFQLPNSFQLGQSILKLLCPCVQQVISPGMVVVGGGVCGEVG